MSKNTNFQDKYPYKVVKDGEEIMSLRKDEVENVSGHLMVEVGDAFERLLWEKSNTELKDIQAYILNSPKKPSRGLMFIFKTIEKILDQRKFMIDNQALRNALLPE